MACASVTAQVSIHFEAWSRGIWISAYLTSTSDAGMMQRQRLPASLPTVQAVGRLLGDEREVALRVVDGSTTLGTLPVERPIRVGSPMIFAGRRWRVLDVHADKKLIQLTPASGGKPPPFTSGVLQVADTVRKRMRAIYRSDHQPAFLDDMARTLLQQGRDAYTRLKLTEFGMLQHRSETIVLPWRGDTVMNTLAVVMQSRGLDVGHEGVLLTVAATTPTELRTLFHELAMAPPPDPVELAATVAVKPPTSTTTTCPETFSLAPTPRAASTSPTHGTRCAS